MVQAVQATKPLVMQYQQPTKVVIISTGGDNSPQSGLVSNPPQQKTNYIVELIKAGFSMAAIVAIASAFTNAGRGFIERHVVRFTGRPIHELPAAISEHFGRVVKYATNPEKRVDIDFSKLSIRDLTNPEVIESAYARLLEGARNRFSGIFNLSDNAIQEKSKEAITALRSHPSSVAADRLFGLISTYEWNEKPEESHRLTFLSGLRNTLSSTREDHPLRAHLNGILREDNARIASDAEMFGTVLQATKELSKALKQNATLEVTKQPIQEITVQGVAGKIKELAPNIGLTELRDWLKSEYPDLLGTLSNETKFNRFTKRVASFIVEKGAISEDAKQILIRDIKGIQTS